MTGTSVSHGCVKTDRCRETDRAFGAPREASGAHTERTRSERWCGPLLIGACLLLACSKQKLGVQGVEVSVASIERTELWQGYAAQPGKEFVVVHLELDARALSGAVTLPAPQLERADGTFAPILVRELSVSGGTEHEAEIGFPVQSDERPAALVFQAGRLELPAGPR